MKPVARVGPHDPLGDRALCATHFCGRPGTYMLFGLAWCRPCVRSVEQANYMASLSPANRERVRYRRACPAAKFAEELPRGAPLVEPLAVPARSGWSSRR